MEKSAVRKLLRKVISQKRKAVKDLELTVSNEIAKDKKITKLVSGVKKLAKHIRAERTKKAELELSVSSLKEEIKNKENFTLEQAKKIVTREDSLSGYDHGYTNEEILDDTKYELAVSKKKIAELEKKDVKLETASLNVGDKQRDDAYYKEKQKQIDEKAFGKQN